MLVMCFLPGALAGSISSVFSSCRGCPRALARPGRVSAGGLGCAASLRTARDPPRVLVAFVCLLAGRCYCVKTGVARGNAELTSGHRGAPALHLLGCWRELLDFNGVFPFTAVRRIGCVSYSLQTHSLRVNKALKETKAFQLHHSPCRNGQAIM